MGPIDYSTDVQSPFQTMLQGFQGGAGIRQVLDQRALAEQQRAAQQQMQKDLGALASNKNATGADYASVMTRYPQLSEQLNRSWGALNQAQQQAKLQQGTQAYAALQAGRADVAEQLFRDRAEAARNSGAEDEAKQSETMAELIKLHPESARTSIALSLSSHLGPDKFAETFGKLGQEQRAAEQAPADLAKKQADAAKAGIDAKYAEQQAVVDLQKKGWDIQAIQADIGFKREANRIALMNAQASREGNALKRDELRLKIEEARKSLDDKIREKVSSAESGATNIDNMLNTIERVKGNKSLNGVLGSIEGRLPVVFSDDAADAAALIENLTSQAFLAQIPNIKGMGTLSNAEGEKLQSALQNLSRTQSEKQFRTNLDEAARLLKKGRENLSRSTGVPLSAPDTPAAPGSRPPLSSFNRGPGGASGDF